ncbi:MAG: flagellar hook-length control protein FliK [Candidatus Marinimicrobia bacterium]|nr:flagellar hook-length control protein FliK [Candidatus Neomarinimicrobiota bacterium]
MPIRSTLAAVSGKPTADRGTLAQATQVVQRGTHALPAIDDKSVSGAGPRSGVTVNPNVAQAGVRQADPSGLTTDLPPAIIVGADAAKTGDGKRLDVRSSRSKRPNITFVKKSDGGTPDVPTAPTSRPAARAVSRPAAQVAPQAQDVGVKGPGANTEPVVNSLTTNGPSSSQVAGGGNGELKIMNSVELGTQGSTETGSRMIQVPVAQTSTLNQPLNSATPLLANLARMTVVHYNRFVSGSQNQSVFQVDGGSLGNVKIIFSEASAGTTLTIMVSSPELQQQLQRALPQLQQEWGNLNLNLGQVNVQVNNSHQGQAFTGEEGKPGRPKQQSTADVDDVPVAMAMERIMDYGYNTVEYVA